MSTVINATLYQKTNLQSLRMFALSHYVELSEALVRQNTLEAIKENPELNWIPTYNKFNNRFHSLLERGMTHPTSLVKLMNMFYEVDEYIVYENNVYGILDCVGQVGTTGKSKVRTYQAKRFPSYAGTILFGIMPRSLEIESWMLDNITFTHLVDLVKVTYR